MLGLPCMLRLISGWLFPCERPGWPQKALESVTSGEAHLTLLCDFRFGTSGTFCFEGTPPPFPQEVLWGCLTCSDNSDRGAGQSDTTLTLPLIHSLSFSLPALQRTRQSQTGRLMSQVL